MQGTVLEKNIGALVWQQQACLVRQCRW